MSKSKATNRKSGADVRSSELVRRIAALEGRVRSLERALDDAIGAARSAGQAADAALYVANYCR